MKVMVTGHRPNKLFGYNLNAPEYIEMKNRFKQCLVALHATEGISGMALGVDTVFALAVLELKNEGYPIKLHCAIPCLNHSSAWLQSSKEQYETILSQADEVVIVTKKPYSAKLMQIRNEYMVDRADDCIAIWDGSNGGTANCVAYIKKCQKHCYIAKPISFYSKKGVN